MLLGRNQNLNLNLRRLLESPVYLRGGTYVFEQAKVLGDTKQTHRRGQCSAADSCETHGCVEVKIWSKPCLTEVRISNLVLALGRGTGVTQSSPSHCSRPIQQSQFLSLVASNVSSNSQEEGFAFGRRVNNSKSKMMMKNWDTSPKLGKRQPRKAKLC